MKDKGLIFWVTILVSFVSVVHGGMNSFSILALSLFLPLIIVFQFKKSLLPLALYLIIFGALGRYSRYFRQNYGSDVLMATRDFVGLLLAGKHPYRELVFTDRGLTPFIYLPFEIFWYLPAQVSSVDLRFFEMIISCLVPIQILLYGFLLKKREILPFLSLVSLTPFLMDLSADGSNDNSVVFILLASVLLLVWSRQKKSQKLAILSSIILGWGLAFKQYFYFYFFFLALFLWSKKKYLAIDSRKYLFISLAMATLIIGPLALTEPTGFLRSQSFIESRPEHIIWGWNFWSAVKNYVLFSDATIYFTRLAATLATILFSLYFIKLDRFYKVLRGAALTFFVFLILSKWTTYAYFTFLTPLFCLGAINDEKTA